MKVTGLFYDPRASGSAPVYSSDGETLLTDKISFVIRCDEHVNALLNFPSSMSDEALEYIPQRQLPELNYPPSLDEVVKAFKQISSGESPSVDGIPAEIFKHGCIQRTKKSRQLFSLIWNKSVVPQDS